MELVLRVYEIAFWAAFALLAWGGSLVVVAPLIDEVIESEFIGGAISLVLSTALAVGATWLVIQLQYSDDGHYRQDRPSYGVGPYEIR